MEKIAAGVTMVLGLMFIMPILGCLFGAFSGWAAGLVFGNSILGFLSSLGADTSGLSMWQVGAAMGFFGGFLKTNVSTKK